MAKNILTAIDAGSEKIKTLIISLDENKKPSIIGLSSVNSNGIKKGAVINIDEAINSIAAGVEAAEKMAGMNINSAYISINGKHITSTNNKGVIAVAGSVIKIDDVYRGIESAKTISIPTTRDIIHVVPRDFIIDTESGIKDPVGMTGTRLEVDAHIVSGNNSAVNNLTSCINRLGLRVDDVIFTGYASATATLSSTEKNLGVLLLDIGSGTTSFCLMHEDAMLYSGCIPFGGSSITSDLAIYFRLSIEDAEKLKLNLDNLLKQKPIVKSNNVPKSTALDILKNKVREDLTKDSKIENPDLIDISALNIGDLTKVSKKIIEKIIFSRLEEIYDMVITQIEQSGFEYRMPAGIVLTGGSSLIFGAAKLAHERFGVPARIGLPEGLSGVMSEELKNPQYSAVVGMILHIIYEERYSENKSIVTNSNSTNSTVSSTSFLTKIKDIFNKINN